ncbi:MAG: c-type cytochrome [Deltaproteobacteria bacterium]|nr:c-type cytochrome [Deltaproteobacteria bacterium]
MKTKTILGIIITAVIFIAVPLMAAEEHKTPTAPKEYIDMKNPMKADKDVLERAEGIFMKKCKKCHGEKGDGKGSGAKDLEIKPKAFTKDYLKNRPDGQLFWIIEKGSANTDMEAMGPGSETNISKDDMWKLVTYIKGKFGK